ncbi:MAG TPA: serine/threonine-protein kinase [Kofleriaceae bacterium]|nr:serine/threonine-protein kinase [Kofleriaceae bacterium]
MTRYELLDRIGVGGMAEIFRGKAVAAGGFEKPVAIKRILPHLSQDRRFVELLIAEAKVLSLLKHRNIVQIFDVGLGDDNKYFLVMEFVDGKDLRAVQSALEARRRRIPFDLVLHIGAEICEALEHAHTARAPDGKPMSLVHRDVSPSNVLLSRAGEVKLTDFGIAKRAESEGTNTGAVRGKFAYISPEQAKNEHLDPRSDVFSVGILLWELITNRRLFSSLDDLAALRAVREANVPRPTEIDARLPPEIDALLMPALARDKARRYPSAGQFGAKLRSLRYGLEVTVGDPATELAKIIDSTEEVERQSMQSMPRMPSGRHDFDPSEATVIRIRTADAFSARDNDASISAAREVIDRFEEEETRQAQLSGDQLRILRSRAPRDSSEQTALPPPLPGLPRARRPSDEATRMRAPISDELPTRTPTPPGDTPPHAQFGADEETRLVVSRDRRTPGPVAIDSRGRPPSAPPPRPRGAAPPLPPGTIPGTPAPVIVPYSPPPAPLPAPPTPPHMLPPPNHPGAPLPFAPPPGPMGWAPPIAAQRPPRDATPTAQDSHDRQSRPSVDRRSMPQVAGFQRKRKGGLKPWMLVVGALLMAVLAFLITRMFIR